jgi:hypothetical protein
LNVCNVVKILLKFSRHAREFPRDSSQFFGRLGLTLNGNAIVAIIGYFNFFAQRCQIVHVIVELLKAFLLTMKAIAQSVQSSVNLIWFYQENAPLSINRLSIHPCRIFLNKIEAMLGVFAHQALDEIADAGAVFIFLGEGDAEQGA